MYAPWALDSNIGCGSGPEESGERLTARPQSARIPVILIAYSTIGKFVQGWGHWGHHAD